MPTVVVYIKTSIYRKMLEDVGGDPGRIPGLIRAALEEAYGEKGVQAKGP